MCILPSNLISQGAMCPAHNKTAVAQKHSGELRAPLTPFDCMLMGHKGGGDNSIHREDVLIYGTSNTIGQ